MSALFIGDLQGLAVEKPMPSEPLAKKAIQSKGMTRAEQHEEALEELHRFVIDFIGKHSYAPTMREIMVALEISSPSVVSYRLDELERDGFLTRVRNISRGIVLNAKGQLAARKSRAETTN